MPRPRRAEAAPKRRLNPRSGGSIGIDRASDPPSGALQHSFESGIAAKTVKVAVEFVVEPYIRFQGQPGEQATMFFLDPSGNALEFKSFKDIAGQLFAT